MTDVQAVIAGTAPCPSDTSGLPELIAAADEKQLAALRDRVFAEYSPFVAEVIWRRAVALSHWWKDRT